MNKLAKYSTIIYSNPVLINLNISLGIHKIINFFKIS